MQVKEAIKKVGAAASSALLIGGTLGAASLADYPGMFVDDNGTPTAKIVVGSQGKVSDVVGAVNVAGSLGQATVQTSEQTKQETASVAGQPGWSATNGQVLDTVNSKLYFGDPIDKVRDTLTADHLDLLSDTTFSMEDGTNVQVEHYLRAGTQSIGFGNPGDTDNQDPFLYVNNPSDVDSMETSDPGDADGESYLYELQANFGEALDFYDTSDGSSTAMNEDVVGQEIELFGDTFQISEDSFSGNNQGQLVLYGSSQETSLQTGESTTLTIGGSDYSINVVAVTGSNGNKVAFEVDGNLRERTEGSTFTLGGEDVRVDDVIQTSSSNSAGYVTFSIGSQKVVLEDGQPVMTGSDESDVEGTHVNLKGQHLGEDISGLTNDANSPQLSSIEVAVGAADNDESYVMADGSFEDPVFGGLSFRFGGLTPDAASSDTEPVTVKGSGSDNAVVQFTTDGGDSATINFAHVESGDSEGQAALEDSDAHPYKMVEGATLTVDDYTFLEDGDFRHLVQVNEINTEDDGDTTGLGDDEQESVTVTLDDAVTGASYEVEFSESDGIDSGDTTTEVIDGQTYTFTVKDTTSEINGNEAVDKIAVTDSESGDTDVFAGLETQNGATVHLVDSATVTNVDGGTSIGSGSATLNLPTGTLSITTTDADSGASDQTGLSASAGSLTIQEDSASGGSSDVTTDVMVGQVQYEVTVGFSSGESTDLTIAPTKDQSGGVAIDSPGVMVVEEKGDDEQQDAYLVTAEYDGSDDDDQVEVGAAYSGDGGDTVSVSTNGVLGSLVGPFDSDDSVSADYSTYGTYVREDTDSQGNYQFHYPDNQAVAGAAFTGAGGELSASGGGGETTVTVNYTGVTNPDIFGNLPDMAMTDQQVTDSVRSGSDLILVGGPAVNTLVAELASQGETWTQDQWQNQHDDQALLQLVENAFTQGHHALIVAGHSAGDTQAAARYLSNYAAHQSEFQDDQPNREVLSQGQYPGQ